MPARHRVLDRYRLEDFAKSRSAAFARDFTIELEPAAAGFAALRDRFATSLLVLMGMVALLLLIACGRPGAVAAEVQRIVREELETVAVSDITTMDELIDTWIVSQRAIAMLSSFFGGLGAALAALGLYGLLAYSVTRRTNEIGIRVALARPGPTSRAWSSEEHWAWLAQAWRSACRLRSWYVARRATF